MDRQHAHDVLSQELQTFRTRSYQDLRQLIGSLCAYEVATSERRPYQIEIQVVWDRKPGSAIRVMGAIDDGGWSAFRPVTADFLIEPRHED